MKSCQKPGLCPDGSPSLLPPFPTCRGCMRALRYSQGCRDIRSRQRLSWRRSDRCKSRVHAGQHRLDTPDLCLGVDFGTSGSRAVVIDGMLTSDSRFKPWHSQAADAHYGGYFRRCTSAGRTPREFHQCRQCYCCVRLGAVRPCLFASKPSW